MRRIVAAALGAIVLTCGCVDSEAGPGTETTFSPAEARAVRAAFDSLYAAVGRLDVPATLAVYDSSSDFAHVFDGDLVRGRPSYDAMIAAMFPGIRAIENAAVDSLFVIPAGHDAAMVVAAFHETIVEANGARTSERGMWSNLFVRRPDGWKVVYGHTTHVVLPSPN